MGWLYAKDSVSLLLRGAVGCLLDESRVDTQAFVKRRAYHVFEVVLSSSLFLLLEVTQIPML